jgi:DNA-directed RNA polymerase specialized sigma24 family protein
VDAQPKIRAAVDRERNGEVLQRVLAESERLLRRQACRHAELPEDAEDALQSAYALFVGRYRGDCDPLAWLYTTVKREAWALRRKPSRRREVSLDDPRGESDDAQAWVEGLPSAAPTPDERAARNEELASRRGLVRVLKPDQIRALCLLGLGFSYAEICNATGWTYTKVNRSVAEGRAELRRRRDANPDALRQKE